jgi:quinol monooxygenase YgiN
MLRGILLATAMLSAALVSARAQEGADRPSFVVTLIEVAPSATAEAARLLKEVAASSRKESGNLRFEVLEQTDWPSHFAILEVWRDGKAFESHSGSTATTQFRAKLKPMQSGHYDERPGLGVAVGSLQAAPTPGAVYVITHVDVTGNFKDPTIALLNKFAEESRKEPNSERFEVWQQANRLNHFNLNEVWANRAAYDAHIAAAATKDFREKVGPTLGAFYDARIFHAIE